MKSKDSRSFLITTFIILTLFSALALYMMHSYAKTKLQNDYVYGEKLLQQSLTQQRQNVVQFLKNEVKSLELMASTLGVYDIDHEYVLSLLNGYTIETGLDSLCISNADGQAVTNRGVTIDISKRDYFHEILRTKRSVISEPIPSMLDQGETIITIASPIIKDGEVSGIVAGAYNSKYIESFLLSSFDGQMHDLIVSGTGEPIVYTLNCMEHDSVDNTVMSLYIEGEYSDEEGYDKSIEEMTEKFENKQSGKAKITKNNKLFLTMYTPLGVNDWYILGLAPFDVLTNYGSSINLIKNIIFYVAGILLSVVLVFFATRKMKIGKKLVTGFMIITLIAGSSGVIGTYFLNSTYNEYSHVLDLYGVGLYEISNVTISLSQVRSYIRDLLYLEDSNDKQMALTKIDESTEKTDYYNAFIASRLQTKNTRQIWTSYMQLLDEYRQVRLDVISLALSNNADEAYKLWRDKCSPLLEQCLSRLQMLTNINLNSTKVMDVRMRAQGVRTLFFIILVIFVAATLSIILSILYSRRINRSLGKIEDAAMRIANGDTGYELDDNLNDEIGTVARVMNINVKEAFVQLREKNKTISDSLDYARKIQKNLLPTTADFENCFEDYGIIWRPRDAVGGDIYWLASFEEGNLLCVCDCTGHGTPGALLTMLVVSSLINIVNVSNCSNTNVIMHTINKKLTQLLNVGRSMNEDGVRDGVDMVLLFVNKEGQATLSSNNMHTFICDGTDVEMIRGQRLCIGEGDISTADDIKTVKFSVKPQDKIYIASDGLFDQVGQITNIPFGYKNFRKLILKHHELKLQEMANIIWGQFQTYMGNQARRDDVTMIGLSVRLKS